VVARVAFEHIGIKNFRNITALELAPAPGLNVVAGDNGQGKTSLLEALYFVATSRSFRTTALKELIRDGAEIASVRARVAESGRTREQHAGLGLRTRSLSIDGKRPDRLFSYALRTPVVAFHPGDLELVSGPATPRRQLLARLALFVVPQSGDDRQRYQQALRERQRALEKRGDHAPELDAYETLLVNHGVALAAAQRRAAEQLILALGPAFAEVAPPGLVLEARYVAAGTTDADVFRAELVQRRAQDRVRKLASFGPHRDDVELIVDGRSARRHASQGQQRMLTLALKLAELACVREARGLHPVLLLDDVASELDVSRSGAVHDLIASRENQVFVTTPRPDWLKANVPGSARADWIAAEGRFQRVK
jgi:DNA replication and repair protein RecF